ncbi:MAG TPA: hypothetical protein VFF64_26715, partial [Candidatus Eremiobacteraceae bacterium]|nr:hypothetical protein [Candidatus Eremiobacteraceae bacterium]
RRNRGYAIAYRIDQRATQTESPAEPVRVPAPLDREIRAGAVRIKPRQKIKTLLQVSAKNLGLYAFFDAFH